MQNLTAENIIAIHEKVQSIFNVEIGIKDPGIIQAIAERPDTFLYDKFEPFDTIFLKAASLMEGIIRMHPFIDGNKRTALLTVLAYLEVNGYSIAYPISAVRYSVEIAKNTENDPASTKDLIEKIAAWLTKHSATNRSVYFLKIVRYYMFPLFGVAILLIIGFRSYGRRKIDKWLAFDVYPEYAKEFDKIFAFFTNMLTGTYSGIISRSTPSSA